MRFIVRKLTSFELSSISGGYQEKSISSMTPFDFVPFVAANLGAQLAYNNLTNLLETYAFSAKKYPYAQTGLFYLGVLTTAIGSFVGTDYVLQKARKYFN